MPETAHDLSGRHFLLLDGWQHRRAPLHWQGWLAEQLVERGAEVDYLTLPDPENPTVAAWSLVVRRALDGHADLTVVAHGLSVLLWLRLCGEAAEAGSRPLAHRAVLVAPPAPGQHGGEVSAPLPPTVTPDALARSTVDPTLLVCAPDDPYLPGGARALYGDPLGLATVEVPGGAHLNAGSGYGPWPEMLEWCASGDWPSATTEAEAFGAQLERSFRPDGHRLGMVVIGSIDDTRLGVVDSALRAHGLEPDRRRALLQPRAGEPTVRAGDAAEFGELYGHEYSVAVVDEAVAGGDPVALAHLEAAFLAAGCTPIRLAQGAESAHLPKM
jgi:predicted alpha/beta hydrolase family esterase